MQEFGSDGTDVEQGENRQRDKNRDRDRGPIAHASFGEEGFIAVKLNHLRRVTRTALRHDKDEVEDPKRIDGPKQQSGQERGFQQGKGDVPEPLPCRRSIDTSGIVGLIGNDLEPGQNKEAGMTNCPALLGGVLLAVLGSLCPFLWFVLTSFKSQIQVEAIPPTWWPDGSLGFYTSALIEHRLLHYIRNSVIVAGATTVIALVVATPAAYALARLRMAGKAWILGGLLCVAMFPHIVIAGPVWQILERLGGLNTHWGLVLPYVSLTLPLAVWILTTFFQELPFELEEAARIDGCTAWQALYRILLPLAAPGCLPRAFSRLSLRGMNFSLPC